MFRPFSGICRSTIVGLTALAAVGVFAAPALAVQTKTLTYKCKYPLIGTNPLSIKIQLDIPSESPAGEPTPSYSITAVATASGNTVPGLGLIEGLAAIEGVATATSRVAPSGGTPLVVKVPIVIPKYVLPSPVPDPLVLNAAGSTPPLTFGTEGGTLRLDKLELNLKATDAAGEPIVLPPVTKDIDGNVVKDSDGDPNTFDVYCKIDAGQDTTFTLPVRNPGPICDCGSPTNPTVTATPAVTSVALAWSGATDEIGIVGYDVYNGTTLVTSTTGTSATVSGLMPNTFYTFRVVAKDNAGNTSSGGTVSTKTQFQQPPPPSPTTVHYGYALTGGASLKNLTTGSLPLKGAIDAELTLATGAYSADLTLAQTQGRLVALGFLPVTAKIGFVPSGKTTGALADGVLTSSSKVRIKVQEVKLFGAIPLAGGNNCQTKSLSDINLTSTDAEFVPTVGGTLTGKFAISDLNGCGALNGLVSPLTAGGGNTISLKLTPTA